MIPQEKLVRILLIDDSPDDIFLTIEAFKRGTKIKQFHIVEDGMEAIYFLRKQGKYRDVPRPDLILLDLNLPKKNGKEVLYEIKKDTSLKNIPVIILSTSTDWEDIVSTYELNANCYISKPSDFEMFIKVTQSIENFWFSTVSLPIN
jgi:chemotaxis family two-component system response regulator Rcp1